jgi:hypothetical protein
MEHPQHCVSCRDHEYAEEPPYVQYATLTRRVRTRHGSQRAHWNLRQHAVYSISNQEHSRAGDDELLNKSVSKTFLILSKHESKDATLLPHTRSRGETLTSTLQIYKTSVPEITKRSQDIPKCVVSCENRVLTNNCHKTVPALRCRDVCHRNKSGISEASCEEPSDVDGVTFSHQIHLPRPATLSGCRVQERVRKNELRDPMRA